MQQTDDYAGQPVAETLQILESDPIQGLDSAEANRRLQKLGPNEIDEREEPLWHRILRRFWGPIPWMIETAALLSALVQKWEDLIIILIMLLVNAFLDFIQEHRALNALKALKQRLANEVLVLRDGHYATIAARELVPGDIVKLKIGDIVPADLQLVSGDYLLIDQSSLTGESLPVSKKQGEIAYANTIVRQGEMLALVVNTGMQTNFHNVVALVAEAERQQSSQFQKMVIRIGNFLILVTVVLVALILVVALSRHEAFIEIARFSLVLTVAAIPVAMPAVLSVTMAIGALNLARKQAIVSRLVAIEELAGVDIFCSDKTGTLTRNEMQVADPVVFGEHDIATLLLVAALASRFENHDPIELPIYHYIDEQQLPAPWQAWQQDKFIPFDPVRKRTEALVSNGNEQFTALKGAPQVLLDLASPAEPQRREIEQMVELLAGKGYRTLAVARQHGDTVELLGLIPMYDPPRDDSRAVIEDMQAHGVQVKMITGDNLAIAQEVGRILGLEGRAMRASDLKSGGSEELLALTGILASAIYRKLQPGEVSQQQTQAFADGVAKEVRKAFDTRKLGRGLIQTHESEIIDMVEQVAIFAEVIPEDKYRIVDVLQKSQHMVGMTGDGVNDAPALKKADVGIAVSNASDAARAAADIILTAPGLSVVNDAIKQARITFERMKSYSIFRIAETIRIILFMAMAIIVFNFYPVTALMIIILALLNDIPILAIAYDNTKVQKNPVRWNMREMLIISSTLGISGVVSSFLLFFILLKMDFSHEMIQSLFFTKLVVAGHGTIYNTRINDWFWRKPYPSWILFVATFSTRVLGTLIAVYGLMIPAVGWTYALYMWLYAMSWFVINDAIKMFTYRILRREGITL